MSKKSRSSNKQIKAKRDTYRANAVSKRELRLKRHLKNHPDDVQSASSLKRGLSVRAGRKPNTRNASILVETWVGEGDKKQRVMVKTSKEFMQAERQIRKARNRAMYIKTKK